MSEVHPGLIDRYYAGRRMKKSLPVSVLYAGRRKKKSRTPKLCRFHALAWHDYFYNDDYSMQLPSDVDRCMATRGHLEIRSRPIKHASFGVRNRRSLKLVP